MADGVHEGVVAGARLGQQGGQGGDEGADAAHVSHHTLWKGGIVESTGALSLAYTLLHPHPHLITIFTHPQNGHKNEI